MLQVDAKCVDQTSLLLTFSTILSILMHSDFLHFQTNHVAQDFEWRMLTMTRPNIHCPEPRQAVHRKGRKQKRTHHQFKI